LSELGGILSLLLGNITSYLHLLYPFILKSNSSFIAFDVFFSNGNASTKA
jgi:hypothetical protein